MSILTRNDYKPKSKSRLGKRRSRSRKKANADKVRQMVMRGISSEFVRIFRALEERRREVDKLPKYLNALRKVLEKPLPDQKEVERLVPTGLKVKKSFENLSEKLDDDMPEDEESKRVYAKVAAGPEYDDFREKAEETLKGIDLFEKIRRESKVCEDTLILPGAQLILRLQERKEMASSGK